MKKELLQSSSHNRPSNVIELITPPALRMEREPTGMELRLAKAMHDLHTGDDFDDLGDDSVVRWIWIKTARAGIHEMRSLTFDVVQKISGKPYRDPKDLWETIIDAASPE